ncbi:regulatory protein, luxR family [Nonomuraea solani]|uniref:Regulatory protein, luxR family n=1 Tax=Nonomuraea solani TaxID=1144553 RepID=A0A1H6BV50_9ACTN|nr:LuxR C-terminal-related transcriptional regulator [Nonomuraea solani]SEG64096.1 regulatory protein, luxR family [Nonomuraea solani]
MARLARRPGNLPAEPTSFIGRRRELADVRRKLADARLVTLVGPGGVGKTRLAIRLASDLGRGFPDGTWLVELAELRDAGLVANAVMAALDLRDQAVTEPAALVLSYLRDKRLLLVVDNCEHLLAATARIVTNVLRAAPGVRVIATSREPLSAPGEHVVPVPPLDLPPASAGLRPAGTSPSASIGQSARRTGPPSASTGPPSANPRPPSASTGPPLAGTGLPSASAGLSSERAGRPSAAIGQPPERTGPPSAGTGQPPERTGPLSAGAGVPLEWGGVPLVELRRNEAVRLFVERAAAGSGTFELTVANQAAVADLCRRLDGLPLAIELAAVRTRVLTVEQILDRLTDRFGLLTGGGQAALPRHQTLRTTIDWSHDLLTAAEQALLRRLCVFAGRFTLDDIEAVCAYGEAPEALNLLSSLVDKSLVLKEEVRGLACYRLHETMREYGRLRLRAAGEEEELDRRYTRYYLGKCRRSSVEARRRLVEWLAWMDLEIDNIRPVLHALTRQDTGRGLTLAFSLGYYWMTRALSEGAGRLDELLEQGGGRPHERAQGHFMRGFLAVLQSDAATAVPVLAEAVRLAGEAGTRSVLAQSLSLASIAASMAGDRAAAERLDGEAYTLVPESGDDQARLMLLQSRALVGLFHGDLDVVRSVASEGVRISRETGDLYSLGMMLVNLGSARLIAGDLDGALPLFVEGLRVAYEIDDRVAQYVLLDALGCHAAGSGRAPLAARLLGAAETVRAGAGASVLPFLAPLLTRAEESATAVLGAAGYAAGFAAGGRLSREAAIALALGEPAPPPADVPETSPLGRREAEVAGLVADGLSNRQIGARLFISEHTVDSHVRGIMNKLGFNSRAQIAAWIAANAKP